LDRGFSARPARRQNLGNTAFGVDSVQALVFEEGGKSGGNG
jgi:hypothetical protein